MSRVSVDAGALKMALNILYRNAERNNQPTMKDAADELKKTIRDFKEKSNELS